MILNVACDVEEFNRRNAKNCIIDLSFGYVYTGLRTLFSLSLCITYHPMVLR